MDQTTGNVNHQGVALETSPYPYVISKKYWAMRGIAQSSCSIICRTHRISGSLLRTAEATGVAGIVFPDRRAAGITPAVVNASRRRG